MHRAVALAGDEQFAVAERHVHRLRADLDRGLLRNDGSIRLTVSLLRLVTARSELSGAKRAICAAFGTSLSTSSSRTLPASTSIKNNVGCASSTATTVPPSGVMVMPASGRGVEILPSSLRFGRSMTETVASSSFSV